MRRYAPLCEGAQSLSTAKESITTEDLNEVKSLIEKSELLL
jgi:hypothetical protein